MAHRRISWQDPSYVGEARSNSVVNKEPFILMATTENYEHEPYVTNDEIKALTQEIIKTIRDIIVSLLFTYKPNFVLQASLDSIDKKNPLMPSIHHFDMDRLYQLPSLSIRALLPHKHVLRK